MEKGKKTSSRQRATRRISKIRKRRIQNRRMIVGITVVASLFCIVVGAQMFQKYANLNELKAQEAELQAELESESQKLEDLREKEEYVKTDEYIEEVARKLGYLFPDEVIFKPEED